MKEQNKLYKKMGRGRERSKVKSGSVIASGDPPIKTNSYSHRVRNSQWRASMCARLALFIIVYCLLLFIIIVYYCLLCIEKMKINERFLEKKKKKEKNKTKI